MLWCFPTRNIRFPKRAKTKTSGGRRPIQVGGMLDDDTATDSALYYLAPNKRGPGKGYVKNPRPPPTPPPNDEFDEATTTRARSATNGYRGGSEKRAKLPPLPIPNNTMTRVATRTAIPAPAPVPVPRPQIDTLPRGPDGGVRPLSSEATSSNRERTENAYETYGDYAQYMSELDRHLGGSPDLALSPKRRDNELGGQVQRGTALATSRISKPTRLGTVNRATATRVGPRPRQSFEMVDRRVLEDGPERTVTISTWREQVADEADQSANMHIYSLDPHDDDGESRAASKDGGDSASSVSQKQRSLPPRPGRSETGTKSNVGSIRTISDEESTGSPPVTGRRTPMTETSKSSEHTNPSRLDGMPVSKSGSSPYVPWNPTPPHTPPRDMYRAQDRSSSRSPHINGINGVRNASPACSFSSARRTADGMYQERSRTPVRSSTPNWRLARQTMSSFHPTQSGSTISTIKSASVIAFENILASCEPPLLHISTALGMVGIKSEDHLRAIARLSEETRDREVREEALKQGVTVMEWAILLDRLHSL